MPGFANDAARNSIMWSDNLDFSGNVIPSRAITTNGQLLIGSTAAPNIQTGILTSPNGTIAIGYSSPNITLDTTGFAFNYTNVTAAMSPYTVLSTDYYISVDCSLGVVTLNFPNSPTFKQTWIVKDRTGHAAANNILITTPSGIPTIDNLVFYRITSNFGSVNILANSTPNYEIY